MVKKYVFSLKKLGVSTFNTLVAQVNHFQSFSNITKLIVITIQMTLGI